MVPTKDQARTAIRAVVEQVKQVLSQPEIGPISEADTRANFIDKYIFNLGYDGIGIVVREYYVKDLKEFIDYLLRMNPYTRIAVEAKSLRTELTDASAAQLVKYASIEGIERCVLTNGREVHMYNQYLKGGVQDKLILKLDLLAYNSDVEFETIFEQLWLLSRAAMEDAAITTLMEQVTLDRAMRQLILDPSSGTIKAIRADLRMRFGLTPKPEHVIKWLQDRIIGKPSLNLVPSAQSAVPVSLASRKSGTVKPGGASLYALIDTGLLPAGAEVTAKYKGQTYIASVQPDGSLTMKGASYETPSAAAVAVTFVAINGWRFWHYQGKPLHELRAAMTPTSAAHGG